MQLTQKLLSRMEELAGVFLKVGTLFLGGKKKGKYAHNSFTAICTKILVPLKAGSVIFTICSSEKKINLLNF